MKNLILENPLEKNIKIAMRLARMRDRSLGQSDEIKALLDIMRGSESMLKICNDIILAQINNKQPKSSKFKQNVVFNSFITMTDGFEKFIDAKILRIKKILEDMIALRQIVKDESDDLKNFESQWNEIKKDFSELKEKLSHPLNSKSEQYSILDNCIQKKALSLSSALVELETKMQQRTINAIAIMTTTNSSFNSNELYRTLTEEI